MQMTEYLYTFSYEHGESELCKLESKYIFNQEEENKELVSSLQIEPSSSAFIKKRLHLSSSSEDYETLIKQIKRQKICIEGFKVEYLVCDDDSTEYSDRLSKLKDVGYSIEGTPDYYHPSTTYGLCYFQRAWHFGVLIKDNFDWHKHRQKPFSYSNSIGANVAKAIVNIASAANTEVSLLDACCGVGTIMLEACFVGYKIDGCDINRKICQDARQNLDHFNYVAKVYRSDLKDINKNYQAAIVDLPYNLFSTVSDDEIIHIMESAAKVTDRLVIVSTSDISTLIKHVGFQLLDSCRVSKSGKRQFARKIWVCKKQE